MNFSKYAIERGGSIHPLLIDSKDLQGPSVTNATIYNDDGKLLVNLRNINYTLYHSEKGTYENHWGPLVYIHPENDMHLRTNNVLCELDEDMRITTYTRIDTSELDEVPLWDFVGLEDVRLVRWDGKLFACGVRRDTTTNGEGRMELSEIENNKEISRFRIPTPGNVVSYCEKNWMPIVDLPYHFVKWSNGTEVVKTNPEKGTCETVVLKNYKDIGCSDLRGGSQVIRFNGYYFALVHETYLFKSEAGRKNAKYRHRFIAWDDGWNIVKVSELFSFMEAEVEFAVGMTEYKDQMLITFGYQDNASYLIKIPAKEIINFVWGNE